MKTNTLTATLILLCALFCLSGCVTQGLENKRAKIRNSLSQAERDVVSARQHLANAVTSFDKENAAAAAIELKLMSDRVTYWQKALANVEKEIATDRKAGMDTAAMVIDATHDHMANAHTNIPVSGTAPSVVAPPAAAASTMTCPPTHMH